MAQANIKAVITAEDRASATLQRFGSKASKFGMLAKVGLLAAGAAAATFGVKSVQAFMESEDAAAQLNAVLKSTKGVAGVTAKSATGLANSLQMVTKFSDETVLGGENLLLTFTKIGKDIFPQATEVMLDMSTALGQDVKASAIQLGKALQDPILGITALRRVGVNFNNEQKETVKRLVETGQQAKAQAFILKELKTEFGGSAKAAGETFGGQLQILKNLFGELMERVGGFIATALKPLVSFLSSLLKPTEETNQKLMVMKGIFQQIGAVINQLVAYYNIYAQAFIKTFKTYWESSIKPALIELWTVIKTQLMPAMRELWTQVGPLLGPALKALGIIVGSVLVAALYVFLRAAIIITKATSVFWSTVAKLIGVLRAVLGPLNTLTMFLWTRVIGAIKAVNAWIDRMITKFRIKQAVSLALSGVYEAIIGPFKSAFNWISSNVSKVKAELSTLSPSNIGKNVGNAAKGAFKAVTPFANGTGFFSPNRYASGTGSSASGMALVGERGPELINLPRGSQVKRNDETRRMMGGGVTNINISVPMLTGSANERRRVARMLIKDIQDIAGMNGKSVADMMTSNYGLVT